MDNSTNAMPSNQQAITKDRLYNDVIGGLQRHPKTLPCKNFYDERGSQLFTQICTTPEYYVTRTELAIMQEYRQEMAAKIGNDARIVEFGSGAGEKIRLLLSALKTPQVYTPVDISEEILQLSAEQLRHEFPNVAINPVVGDYTKPLENLNLFSTDNQSSSRPGKPIVYFPGSTLSNFTIDEATLFLQKLRRLTGKDGGLLIGVDLIKDSERLDAAYNDKMGFTAAFNLNLLERINRELKANFNIEQFAHHAFYNKVLARIEMHLISRQAQTIEIADQKIHFEKDESIHTENSYKYSIGSFTKLAQSAGFAIEQSWTDAENLFSVHYLS